MAKDIFSNARKNAVYYKLGTFEDDRQKWKYVRAPFDIIQMNANNDVQSFQYFSPSGMGDDISQAFNNDAVAEEQILGRDGLAYHTLNNKVIGEHEMGNWEEHPDDFRGFHRIGLI